jgi:hypothetical protein
VDQCYVAAFDTDPGRAFCFAAEQPALDFAHFESQLAGVTAVVSRLDQQTNTMIVLAEYLAAD